MTARAGTPQSYRIRHPPVPRTTPRRRHPGGYVPTPQDCAPPPGARPRRGSRHPAPGPGSSPDGSRLCRRFEISVPVAASSYWELQIEQRHQKHSSCQRPSCLRSSCQRAPQGITKFGNAAAGRELINALRDALPASASGPTAAEVWQRNQPARWGTTTRPRAQGPSDLRDQAVVARAANFPAADQRSTSRWQRARHAVSLSPDVPVFPCPTARPQQKKPALEDSPCQLP
jgi:hypothetical protein